MTLDRSDKTFRRVRDLTTKLVETGLSDLEKDEFEGLLGANPEMREWYIDHMAIHGMLRYVHSRPLNDGLAPDERPPEITADGQVYPAGTCCKPLASDLGSSPVLEWLGDAFHAGAHFFTRSFVLTLILAIGLPCMLLVALFVHISSQPIMEPPVVVKSTEPAPVPRFVAEVTRTHDCEWSDSKQAVSVGESLSPGRVIQLDSGLLELKFAGGATALLEGPVTFDVQNAREGYLKIGNLVAKVPKGAEGFSIVTPSAMIVDLGTEFGVSVLSDGTAEAHVFQGEIEVVTRPATKQTPPATKRFVAGQSVQVSADKTPQLVEKELAVGKFIRHIPDTLPEPKIIFAHHGANNPGKERWQRHVVGVDDAKKTKCVVGPVKQGGVAAWSCENHAGGEHVYYAISKPTILTEKLLGNAKKKGWVYRARVWISDQSPRQEDPSKSLGLLTFRDEKMVWSLFLSLDPQGNQRVYLRGMSSLGKNAVVPVPNSRNQYVDYEMRHAPGAKGADVYINGRCVATDFWNKRMGDYPTVRFGMWRFPGIARFAKVEWGILREPDKASGKKPNKM